MKLIQLSYQEAIPYLLNTIISPFSVIIFDADRDEDWWDCRIYHSAIYPRFESDCPEKYDLVSIRYSRKMDKNFFCFYCSVVSFDLPYDDVKNIRIVVKSKRNCFRWPHCQSFKKKQKNHTVSFCCFKDVEQYHPWT